MIAGPGLAAHLLARKIRGRAEQIGLIVFAGLLTTVGLLLLVPMVNHAVHRDPSMVLQPK